MERDDLGFPRSPISPVFEREISVEEIRSFCCQRTRRDLIRGFETRRVHFVRNAVEWAELTKLWATENLREQEEASACEQDDGYDGEPEFFIPPLEVFPPRPIIGRGTYRQSLLVRSANDEAVGAGVLSYLINHRKIKKETHTDVWIAVNSIFVASEHYYEYYGSTILTAVSIILIGILDYLEEEIRNDPDETHLLVRVDLSPVWEDNDTNLQYRGANLANEFVIFVDWLVRIRTFTSAYTTIFMMDETLYPDGFREDSIRSALEG